MDLNQLKAAVSGGESERQEFKKSTGELRRAMETLCAFANGDGGQVLIGVFDAGAIVGQQVGDSTLQELGQAMQRLEPPIAVTQERIPVRDLQEVLVLTVAKGEDGPYLYDGRPWQRVGTTTQRMPGHEYERRLLERLHSQHRWENRPVDGYTLEDLDLKEIETTINAAVEAGRIESAVTSTKDVLMRLGMLVDDRILQAAVVAFGKNFLPNFPQCALRLARFRGTDKTEFLDQNQMHGHAFSLLREADLFIRRHLPVAGRIEPGLFDRADQPIFPPLALREALVNALCHRDYTVAGGAVSVAIFDDRLEITSTGTLPHGITVSDLKREHTSRPRNPILSEVFYRRGLIERWGRGTQKIVELCRAAGHPEPEFDERAGEVVVRFLPSGYIAPHRVSRDLSQRQREILQILADGRERSLREIHGALKKPPADRTLRDDLTALRNLEQVESHGRGAGARWRLRRDE